jgi:hypothetical protein
MAQNGWSKVDILLSQSGGMTAWVNGVQSWTHPEWTGGGCGWAPSGHSIDLPNMLDGPERGHVALGEYGYDDILFDTTQSRVELCPGSTWAARGGCESQPATSWGASSVAVTVNRGGFATGNAAYLYVIDSTGSANANGYSVTIGGGGGTTYTVTPSAGANGSISPNTAQTVNSGSTTTFTVTPNSGYAASASGCGGSLSGTTYTTGVISTNCTVTVTFSALDTTPPVISSPLPAGVQPYGTTSVTLQVTTNENATCKYNISDAAYASMSSTFASTGGTTHQQVLATANGTAYTRYVRCIDGFGNANSVSSVITFTVASDSTPPVTTINTSDPSTTLTNNLVVAGISSDNVAIIGCKWRVGSAPNASNGTACSGTTSFSCNTNTYAFGANTLYVGCYDSMGNYGSDSMVVNYIKFLPIPSNLRILTQ